MILIKIGGGQTINKESILKDLVEIKGKKLLVHGGNYELNELSKQLHYPPKMITSKTGQKSRFTDEKTMDMFMMTYAGKINKRIVERLQQLNTQAVGLSCLDGGIVKGTRRQSIRCVENGKDVVLHGDYTGSIDEVNTELLTLLLNNGYLPVITSPILSFDGEALNVDHDKLAMQIAIALHVETLVYLFEAPGLLKDFQDESSLLKECKLSEIDTVLEYAEGRMKKKVLSAKWALEQGIQTIIFADGRVDHPVTKALQGVGTVFTQG
jgi:acetylglutamate/LysW-gamma-L-alpha-aminoadipate kinase